MVKKNTTKRKTKQKKQSTTTNVTALGRALRTLGSVGGSALGSAFGSPALGSKLGSGAGAIVSRWMGQGDYSINNNTLWAGKSSTSIPAMHKTDQSIRVSHREFLTKVVGSTGYSVAARYNLNPGLSATFPWLSQLACRFQEYRIHGLVFHYIPTSGASVSSTNPALGAVMFHTSYRASDSPPNSKVELLNEYWSTETVPSEPCFHPVECDPKASVFPSQWVRSSDPPSGESVMLYDLGITTIATDGMPAGGNTVGDLWVTYDVELRKPLILSDVVTGYPYLSISGTGTGAMPLQNITTFIQKTSECTVSQLSNTTFNFGAIAVQFDRTANGIYQITVQSSGITTTSMAAVANTVGTGASTIAWRPGGSVSPMSIIQTTGNNDFLFTNVYSISGATSTAEPYVNIYPSTNVAWYSAGTPTFTVIVTKICGSSSF